MAFTGYFHHPYDPQYRLAIHSSVIHYFFPHRRFIPKKLFSQRLRQNDVIESRFQPAGISLYHRKMENIKKAVSTRIQLSDKNLSPDLKEVISTFPR